MCNCWRFRWKSMLYGLQESERVYNKHMCLDWYSFQKQQTRGAAKPNLVEEKQILAEFILQMSRTPIPCPWKKLEHFFNCRLLLEQWFVEMQGRLYAGIIERAYSDNSNQMHCNLTPLRNCGLDHVTSCQSNILGQSEWSVTKKSPPKKDNSSAVPDWLRNTRK